jgi:predicted helicase
MPKNPYQTYWEDIKNKDGGGTEFTYRTYFENLLNEIKPNKDINIIQEPKKDEHIIGRPDFKIERNGLVMGYIETKPLGMNLDEIIDGNTSRESKQLKSYVGVSPNLILTNYNEFILFKNGKPVDRGVLFFPSTDRRLNRSNIFVIERLFNSFFEFSPEMIVSSKKLSSILAERTKKFRDYLKDLLENEEKNEYKDRLGGLKKVLEDTLIENLSQDDFIDAYAQTITYGLFLAEINSKEKISEEDAYRYIPKSMGILRELFKTTDIEDIPDSIDWILEEIIDVLNRINRKKLKNDLSFSQIYDYEDPYVYFYENFLRDYNKHISIKRGVFYTPIPVVNFIVKSINNLIKENFSSDGLKSEDIKVLDFATGTGTFLLQALDIVLENTDEGMKGTLIHERLIKNYYGFEYLMAPYTIAHLKLSQYLEELGYPLNDEERFKIYLTDTLDRSEHKGLDYFTKLTNEGREANTIKTKEDILVMMGNPPYNSKSKNNKEWILKLIETYKKGLNEKNIQPLNNDYIKFIRYAHWKIEQNGKGIIGIITSNSYLDGLVHRVMRKELLKTFDKLYILNLHGNKRKKEPDENVFDIQEGVSIVLFLKLSESLDEKEVYYYSTLQNTLITREIKYGVLLANDVTSLDWIKLKPSEPDYWFTPKDMSLEEEYHKGFKLTEIFKLYKSGIQSGRDNLFIDYNKAKLKERIETLLSNSYEQDFVDKYDIKNSGGYPLLNRINKSTFNSKNILPLLYRPFDNRYLYYDEKLVRRNSFEIMENFFNKNIGLVSVRQFVEDKIFNHIFVSDKITDIRITTSNRGTGYIFPLFSYKCGSEIPITNFTMKFTKFLTKTYSKPPIPPIVVFSYIYAILHSSNYRERYNEFLKTDFPIIPFTKDIKRFKLLAKLGRVLINAHLLNQDYSDSELAIFPIAGDNLVNKIEYDEHTFRLYVNKEQYFENVPEEVWDMEICGYQVIKKWLQYRKKDGIKLSFKDITHLQKVVRALNETISVKDHINQVFTKLINE